MSLFRGFNLGNNDTILWFIILFILLFYNNDSCGYCELEADDDCCC